MDGNAHNIAAWNAYRATALEPIIPPQQVSQPHIPHWAKWFKPEPVPSSPKVVISFLILYYPEDVLYDKISPITKSNTRPQLLFNFVLKNYTVNTRVSIRRIIQETLSDKSIHIVNGISMRKSEGHLEIK